MNKYNTIRNNKTNEIKQLYTNRMQYLKLTSVNAKIFFFHFLIFRLASLNLTKQTWKFHHNTFLNSDVFYRSLIWKIILNP